MWKDAKRFIERHKSFVLTTHIHPEGDAIGSEIAMAAFLGDIGKSVTIVNSSPTPQNCAFLDPDGAITSGCYLRNRGPISCANCGYAAHAELSLAFGGRPSAVLTGLRTFAPSR